MSCGSRLRGGVDQQAIDQSEPHGGGDGRVAEGGFTWSAAIEIVTHAHMVAAKRGEDIRRGMIGIGLGRVAELLDLAEPFGEHQCQPLERECIGRVEHLEGEGVDHAACAEKRNAADGKGGFNPPAAPFGARSRAGPGEG